MDWKITLTTQAMMTTLLLLSMMYLAASRFVTRVNSSHGHGLPIVTARAQTQEKSKIIMSYPGVPNAMV